MSDERNHRNPSGIRRARADEAGALSDLALRSKAMWGYSAAFIEACRDELTVTEEQIRDTPVYVHDGGAGPDGFYGLAGRPPRATLEYLFVAPEATRRGVGTKLLKHAVAVACRLGFTEIEVESDPNAVPFYERGGGVRIGEVESTVEAGRRLPLLLIDLG